MLQLAQHETVPRSAELREVRIAVSRHYGPVDTLEYLRVADAVARGGCCTRDDSNVWIAQGKLRRYHAGRVLRVRKSELEFLLRSGPESRVDGRRLRKRPPGFA